MNSCVINKVITTKLAEQNVCLVKKMFIVRTRLIIPNRSIEILDGSVPRNGIIFKIATDAP